MEFNGFVNIVKPTGMTSSDVVCKIKKILGIKKVGHLGTLDPAASGVLPIAVGRCTKFFDYFLSKDKEYIAVVKFGVLTDTLDSFGKIMSSDNKIISEDEIKQNIKKFVGKINQIPPKFSAIKINGEKACDLARRGESFEIKPREIEIFSIGLLDKISENTYSFKVHCSAGTYIRTLFDDIAQNLGTRATVPVIIRSKSGPFKLDNAQTLEEFENGKNLLSTSQIFEKTKIFEVELGLAKKIINGSSVLVDELKIESLPEIFFINCQGKIIGLFKTEKGKLERIVFLWKD